MGKILDGSGLKALRNYIQRRLSKKLDSVAAKDASVEVTEGRKIKARVSEEEDNLLRTQTGTKRGLYVPGSAAAAAMEAEAAKHDDEVDAMLTDVFGPIGQ